MRTIDATLLAAMNSGSYQPYFLATISDNYNGNVYISGMPVGYELGDLELIFTIQMSAFMDVPFYRTSVVLQRGVTIAGLNYTLSTSKFVIIKSTWDGNFQTFYCHLIPRAHYSAPGDLTYRQVITAFCSTFGKTAVFLYPDPYLIPDWLIYQYFETGKFLTLNNAQTFFTQLKQKYFIFACDNGNDEILFYTGFTHVDSYQYAITGYRYAVDYNVDQKRQYVWHDENLTLHQTVPSFSLAVHPYPSDQCILSLCDLGVGKVLAGSYDMGYIYRSSDYGKSFTSYYDTVTNGVYSILSLGNGIVLAAGCYGGWVLRSTDYGLAWTSVLAVGDDTCCCLADCGNGIVLVGHISPAGAPGSQVYKSLDYGLTWALQSQLSGSAVDSMIYIGGGACLAGTRPGAVISRSSNRGSTWTIVQSLGAENGVYSLVGLGNSIILAGTNPNGCIYKSSNGGLSWSLKYNTGEQTVYTLNTLGGGVVIAGTGMGGKVFRSVDYGETWTLIQALGSENSIRSFVTLGNGATLAGTGENGYVYKSLNCSADLEIIHNLGFMPSTAVEPSAYFELSQPKFAPFPVHLKYQSSDFIRLNLIQGGIFDITCAEVIEILDLSKKFMPWRMIIGQCEWLSDTAGGPMPQTFLRSAAYVPLNIAGFNNVLAEKDNNVQVAMDALDNHMHGPQINAATEKASPSDADVMPLVDSLTSTKLVRKISWLDIKTAIYNYLVPNDIVGTHAGNTNIGAGVTSYLFPYLTGFNTNASNAVAWPKSGTLRNLYIRTIGTQPATGSMVITLVVNGVASNVVVTIPANGAAGIYSDLIHSVALTAGQTIRWQVVNNATSTSAAIAGVTMELDL